MSRYIISILKIKNFHRVCRYIGTNAFIFCVIFVCTSCYDTRHPTPQYHELYEVKDPNTSEVVFQILACKWTDGIYSSTPVIKTLRPDDCTWMVSCHSENPKMWTIYRLCPGGKPERIEHYKIFTSRNSKIQQVGINDYRDLP